MKKTLSIDDFTNLLIATLAYNTQIIDLNDCNKKIASLPLDYKQRIEKIMYTENEWNEEFSILINTDDYFKNHFNWEQQLAMQLKKITSKKYEIDFLRDCINITLDQEEVNAILSKYSDNNLTRTMLHFTTLLTDYIYSREFQEISNNYNIKNKILN